MAAGYTLAELAARCGGEVRGDGATRVDAVATLQNGRAGAISFLANPHYKRHLADTKSAAVILSATDAEGCKVPALITKNPYLLYAKVAALLAPESPVKGGVHPAAVVDPAAKVDASAWVGPGAVVEAGVEVAARASIGPNCVLLAGAKLGEDSRLSASVTLCKGVSVGKRALIHPGAVIGADGFGIAPDSAGWVKVPQLGSVRIGDDVEIGACTTVDRGALEDTVIEDGVKLDNQIQVGHNCRIGAHTAMAGCAAVAGSAEIGKRCTVGAGALILGHLSICDDVEVSADTVISRSIREPGTYTGMFPFDDNASWARNTALVRHLAELADRVRALEQRLKVGKRKKGARHG